MYLNKIYILGNLSQAPELKTMPTGNKVCTFSVATNRTWKDGSGQKKESAEFHSIVTYGRQAEICAQYLQKGSQILIEGRVQTRSWDDTEGKKRYKTEIIAENIQLGNRPSESKSSKNEPHQTEDQQAAFDEPPQGIDADETPF